RRGLTALAEFDKGPSGKPRKYHVYSVKPAKSDDSAKDSGSAGGNTRVSDGAQAAQPSDRPRFYATDPALRRGRLNNGNPAGDFLAAPRCGAGTRHGGDCRQPAMANGRCRFHGGKSTGPRSAEGLARARAARRSHGGYSAEIIELRKTAAYRVRRLRALLAAMTSGHVLPGGDLVGANPCVRPFPVPAGHGVDRHRPHPSRAALAKRARNSDKRMIDNGAHQPKKMKGI
ncbi:MAG: HGGxSTG domain-containing protein, partial [Dongiaceae bacterium]